MTGQNVTECVGGAKAVGLAGGVALLIAALVATSWSRVRKSGESALNIDSYGMRARDP
jgi:hypothetical protein